ncbi:hypothetical protein [Paraburkholderia sacchari]|uniref:hypothetical protein n=1 Tax=Paraburkholderia sacchari TaxID=159450 RepID=UPI003CC828C3
MNRPSDRFPLRTTGAGPVWRWIKWGCVVAILAAIALIVRIVQIEIDTSRLQAHYLSELTRDIGFAVEPGPSPGIRFPTTNGPYDVRLGYAELPAFTDRLEKRGFIWPKVMADAARHRPCRCTGSSTTSCRCSIWDVNGRRCRSTGMLKACPKFTTHGSTGYFVAGRPWVVLMPSLPLRFAGFMMTGCLI